MKVPPLLKAVVVAEPEPRLKVAPPLLIKPVKNRLPDTDPRLPLLVRPANVSVPKVEVTVVLAPMVEPPATVKFRPAASKAPAPPVVTKVPLTTILPVRVAVPVDFRIRRLLKFGSALMF